MILDQQLGRFNYGYDGSVITEWDLWVDSTFAKVGAHQVKPTQQAFIGIKIKYTQLKSEKGWRGVSVAGGERVCCAERRHVLMSGDYQRFCLTVAAFH